MPKNFLITAFGRSGTKFLSQAMNLSEQWTVLHEPRGPVDQKRLTRRARKHFSRDYYGEVNSRMKFRFYDIELEKRGIIFRDPREITTSLANRKSLDETQRLIGILHHWFTTFHEWLESDPDIVKIEFRQMLSDPEYLGWILKEFGILDVDPYAIDRDTKVNANKVITYKDFNALPDLVKEKYFSYNWEF